jgi:hypothetical protein
VSGYDDSLAWYGGRVKELETELRETAAKFERERPRVERSGSGPTRQRPRRARRGEWR